MHPRGEEHTPFFWPEAPSETAKVLTSVEEHVSDDALLAVDFERMSAEHDALHDDAVRITTQHTPRRHHLVLACAKDKCFLSILPCVFCPFYFLV